MKDEIVVKQVEDNPELVRTMDNKAIINTNSTAYNQRKLQKEKAKKRQEEQADEKERINRLEEKVDKLTSLMERVMETL